MKARFENTGMIVDGVQQPNGYIIDVCSQKSYLHFFVKAVYDFRLVPENPLTYIDAKGIKYQPDRHFQTDQGTIPRAIQWMIQKDRFLGFYFHDSAYRFGGLYINRPEWKRISYVDKNGNISFLPEYRWQEMTRSEADKLLRDMMQADPCPGNWLTRWSVWAAVRAGGIFAWGRGDERQVKPAAKLDAGKLPVSLL